MPGGSVGITGLSVKKLMGATSTESGLGFRVLAAEDCLHAIFYTPVHRCRPRLSIPANPQPSPK